jgi:hypothetical protein
MFAALACARPAAAAETHDAPGATPSAAASAPPGAAASYEALAEGAARTQDVATLLAPFVERCDARERDVDKTRCRAITGYLRRTLPQRTYAVRADDPAAISVSDYDASVKGYHLALAGCIACTKPVALGREGESRLITVKVPEKPARAEQARNETQAGDPGALAKAVTLTRNTFAFDSLVEAKRWLEGARPFLRAEFLVRLDPRGEASWTFGPAHGVALNLVGARVYNRCTGEVLVSTPPSTGRVERAALGGADEPGCRGAVATPGAASTTGATLASPEVATPAELPAQLTKTAIADAMARIRPTVFACYRKFLVAGTLELTYDVAGNGTVQSVQVGPAFAGTPTGICALEAGKDAHFSPFQLERQKFTYPFFLRP